MDGGIMDYFLKKKVKIFLQNDWCYRGEMLKIGSDCVLIDDVKKGLMTININAIRNMTLWESEDA